ncbi:Uncharacterised protein [Mycobacterium tuberculosis]|nr:Uncharacterised protein [Mycobacterium tuberculosis]
MPGRFREGTETCIRKVRTLETLPTCRQTQNPERGRKLNNTFFERGAVESVVRPKTPRGDGNARNRPTWACPQRVVRPKTPRGDGNAPWMADALCAQVSSDPKPREGTETSTPSVPHTGPVPCRQTQNPERGRKPDGTELSGFYQVVVRPKTPRGDGNPHGGTWTSATIGVVGPKTTRGDGNLNRPSRGVSAVPESSDPKPREGTETRNPAPHPQLRHAPEVVRPKTPRGDGNPHGGTWTSATIGVVGPKTPRGDGNWTQNRTGCGRCSSRQTQNPERGRKPDDGQ